jgi:hypothetical protein
MYDFGYDLSTKKFVTYKSADRRPDEEIKTNIVIESFTDPLEALKWCREKNTELKSSKKQEAAAQLSYRQ